MMNFETMVNVYDANSASHAYIIGFIYRHILYFIKLNHAPHEAMKPDTTGSTRGNQSSLRLRVNKAQKLAWIEQGAIMLGGEDLLHTNDKYNRGERFERVITELYGQTWVKDAVPFWVGPDIVIDGENVQIKLDSATFLTESTVYKHNLLAAVA